MRTFSFIFNQKRGEKELQSMRKEMINIELRQHNINDTAQRNQRTTWLLSYTKQRSSYN